jgi:integrase
MTGGAISTRSGAPRRPRGTGALFVKRDGGGREVWYGKWRVGSTQVKRRIGPKRIPSTSEGLTKSQAEAELRRLIGTVEEEAVATYRATVADGGELVLARATIRGRKKSTLMGYESLIRIHLVPHFGERPLREVGRREIDGFIRQTAQSGRSVKTTFNALGVLHSIFEAARREGWVAGNPCTLVDKPRAQETDPDIHFLEPEEVEALLRGVPDDDLGRVERRMYLTAAMTGDAPGRAARAALARHRLAGAAGPRAAQLRARRVRDAEVETLVAERPAGRPARRRARPAPPGDGLSRG